MIPGLDDEIAAGDRSLIAAQTQAEQLAAGIGFADCRQILSDQR